MEADNGWLTPSRVKVLSVLVVLVVAAVVAAVAVTRLSSPGPSSHGNRELEGYSFVYHDGPTVTVVKQSFTTNMSNLTVSGPGGSVDWVNASGGASNMAADFSYRQLGVNPGDTIVIKQRVGSNLSIQTANSTVPDGPGAQRFVFDFHQRPAVTVVNVDSNETNTTDLELVGPHGSVPWSNATLGSRRTAATFAYNRHALGATAGDNVTLARVDPATGNRTNLTTKQIP